MQPSTSQVYDSLLDVRRASEQLSPQAIKNFARNTATSDRSSRSVYKNLFGVCFMTVFCFASFFGLQNLQSSINTENGLGLVSLTVLNSCFIISGFFTPTIIRLIGTKYSLVTSCVVFLTYTATNYYPHWYTLIPSSVLLGIWFGPTWASMNVHITTTAITHARAKNEKPSHYIAMFTGILTAFVQLAQIGGNLASSVILFNSAHSNETTDGITNSTYFHFRRSSNLEMENDTALCENTEAANLENFYLYILVSLYVIFDIAGLLVCLLLLDHNKTDTSFLSCGKLCTKYLSEPLWSILKALFDWRMILLVPMIVFNGAELSFVSGRFAEFFISDCVGVKWVGLALMTVGLFSGLAALTAGRMVKYIPEYVIIYTGVGINLILILFLLFWVKSPNFFVIFGFVIGWGLSDGIWNTMGPGITGILFHDRQEAGFSANRIWLAAGFVVGFLTADVITETQQLWILLGLVVLTGIFYTVLAGLTQKKEDLFPCCFHAKTCSNGAVDDPIPEGEIKRVMADSSQLNISEPISDQAAGAVNKLFNRKVSLDLNVWKNM